MAEDYSGFTPDETAMLPTQDWNRQFDFQNRLAAGDLYSRLRGVPFDIAEKNIIDIVCEIDVLYNYLNSGEVPKSDL